MFMQGKASLLKDITITSKLCLAHIPSSLQIQPHTDTTDTKNTTGIVDTKYILSDSMNL